MAYRHDTALFLILHGKNRFDKIESLSICSLQAPRYLMNAAKRHSLADEGVKGACGKSLSETCTKYTRSISERNLENNSLSELVKITSELLSPHEYLGSM